MTEHLDVRYAVRGNIVTDDSTLLDTIQSELPDASEATLGAEYSANRTADAEDLAEGEERLSARMTFSGDSTDVNGATVTPQEAAQQVFNQVTTHDLAAKASNWEVQMYRTPEGGITVDDVRAYYEENTSEQPTDEDGKSYVPNNWDPSNHIEAEETG